VRLCLRLRGRWALTGEAPRFDLPPTERARLLAKWLAGPRSRALRRAQVGRRRRVLEVGCGYGLVTAELARRAAGPVVALDPELSPAQAVGIYYPAVAGDALRLPFREASFDLVFCQNLLLWVSAVERAVAEAARVLQPGGALVALEPDYGGMLEHPALGLRELWLAALARAGADPQVGRRLPAACEAAGLRPWVELTHLPQPATPEAVRLLEGLPLTSAEQEAVERAARQVAERRSPWGVLLHVPYVLLVAER